jgi:hypothetical protein
MTQAVDLRLEQLQQLLFEALKRGNEDKLALALHSIATEFGEVNSET